MSEPTDNQCRCTWRCKCGKRQAQSKGELLADLRETMEKCTSADSAPDRVTVEAPKLPSCSLCHKQAGPSFVVMETPTGPLCNACFGKTWKAAKEAAPEQKLRLKKDAPPAKIEFTFKDPVFHDVLIGANQRLHDFKHPLPPRDAPHPSEPRGWFGRAGV